MPDTLRAEPAGQDAALPDDIDRLDDALHDLLMRRAELAAARGPAGATALRPGQEAATLRRLLGRHAGPLPRAALVRIWRELEAATAALRGSLGVAAWLPEEGIEALRAHLGLAAPVTRCADDVAALAAQASGAATLVALPAAGRWWRTHYPSRLFVTARLPAFAPAGAPVFLLSPMPPDASGDDRSVVRVPSRAEGGLAGAGLAPEVLRREDELSLVEVRGMLAVGDVRLASLGATVLGSYAASIPA